MSLTHKHTLTHTYPSRIYSRVPLGYLLELFHRGPCLLEWVFLAIWAFKRSHRLLTHRGYPRSLAHSQALLPGLGFTSKTQRRGDSKRILQLTSSSLYMNWQGELQPICITLPLFSPGTRLCWLIGYFDDLPIGGVKKHGTSLYIGSKLVLIYYKKWSHQHRGVTQTVSTLA